MSRTLEGLEDLHWQRPEELIEFAREREAQDRSLTSDELLALKSKTFYPAIRQLALACGKNETPKETEVRNMYCELRELDTMEDAPQSLGPEDTKLTVDEKVYLIDRFCYVVDRVVERNGNCNDDLDDIINGPELTTITRRLESVVTDNAEKVFVRHFGKGPVLKELSTLDKEVRKMILYGIQRMGIGMKTFLQRGETQTVEQLREYCSYVAGSIGEFLNHVVRFKDHVMLKDELSRSVAEFLQLTNIIKNVREDYLQQRIYFPREYRSEGISHYELVTGRDDASQDARKDMLAKMLKLATDNFAGSMDYITSIKPQLSGYRAFCLSPVLAADETIRLMHQAGAEGVFAGAREAIAIPSETYLNILSFSNRIALLDQGGRLNEWLHEYRKNRIDEQGNYSFASPHYSFSPDAYTTWLKDENWLKEKSQSILSRLIAMV